MKNERGDKGITKFEAKVAKPYDHEKEDSEFMTNKGVKKFVSHELAFFDHEKCIFDAINDSLTK